MYCQFLFVTILLTRFLYVCNGSEREFDERAEYFNEGDISSFSVDNEAVTREENPLAVFSENRPLTMVIELKQGVLEKVKNLWEKESRTDFPITIATYDSTGLKEVFRYNETSDLRRGISNLKASHEDIKPFGETLHVLREILQRNLTNGILVLVTATKPSDEDFDDVLAESLMSKRCQLSVLWAGKTSHPDDYLNFKKLATKSGGQFGFLSEANELIEDKRYQEPIIENLDNISGRVRFPEEEKETSAVDVPLTSRALNQKILPKISVPLIVEVASGASLETRPGVATQIPFTVKNNLNVAIPVFFHAKYNGVLQTVQPQQVPIQPGSSITVIVTLRSFASSETSALGTVTLLATAANKVISRSAIVSLTAQPIIDRNPPKITYKYEGDCSNYKEPNVCENGHWSLEATLYDEESGLLKILSEPYGLLFQSEFVAGTKTPVTVFYTATCCQPTVRIWSEDLKGNQISKSFDILNQTLYAGEIAAVVLGTLLLFAIIIGIIIAVVMYKRRNRRNLIIPTTRTDR